MVQRKRFVFLCVVVVACILCMKLDSLLLDVFKFPPKRVREQTIKESTVVKQHHLPDKVAVNESSSAWIHESSVKVSGVECSKLINGDMLEMNKSLGIMQYENHANVVPFFGILKINRDCEAFKRRREYILQAGSAEEAEFPIAYSILVYKDFPQVERLLRAIYRPQNVYCIHYDSKSPVVFKDQVNQLANCFHNVQIASRIIQVKWGYFSVLEADLICMEDLLKHKAWKYLINLTGQEFPLKTNRQMVKILKAYHGANDVGASLVKRDDKRLTKGNNAPHNITVLKGPVHMAASRAFVDFILSNRKAKDFLDWVHGTQVPDETYFSTLQNNPHLGAPGAFGGGLELMEETTSMVRFKLWYYSPLTCHGKRIRLICVFNIGDLPNLTSAKQLFANKFLYSYGQHAYDCLEEWHRNRTRDEYLSKYTFDASEYSELPFVKHRTNLD